jgi:hypothetical protein
VQLGDCLTTAEAQRLPWRFPSPLGYANRPGHFRSNAHQPAGISQCDYGIRNGRLERRDG